MLCRVCLQFIAFEQRFLPLTLKPSGGLIIFLFFHFSDAHPDVFISGIMEGSVAANCQRLQIGHRIIAVKFTIMS